MQRFPLSAIRLDLHLRAPFVFAIGMMTGAIWYFTVDEEPSRLALLLTASVVGLALLWSARRGKSGWISAALMLVSGCISGGLAGSAATLRTQPASVSAPIGPVLVEGWITDAQPANRGVRLVLRVHAIDGVAAGDTPNVVRMTHISGLKTEPGRFVRCWAVLRPPPTPVIQGDYDFSRQAWYSGLGAVGYVQGRCRGGALGQPSQTPERFGLRISEARRNLALHVNRAAGERAGGFAAALASGDRSFMRRADQDALRGSGLAHLLAISGLHMGIVGGLIFLIAWRTLSLIEPLALRWPIKKPAALMALLACAAYLIISGASVSTQRAFIMAAIVFGAVLVDRTALSLRSLSIAMIVVLILAPWTVLTPGFQMSFAATAALIATYEAWQTRRRSDVAQTQRGIAFWVNSLIVTSTVSSAATMPFAMFHFGRIAGLGLVANLAAMPVVSLISAPLAAAALLLAPLGLDHWALRGFGLSLEWILAIAHYVASFGAERSNHLPQMPALSLAFFAAAIVAYCLSRRMASRCLSILCFGLLAGAVWGMSAHDRVHWSPSGDVFVEHADGTVERIVARAGEGLSPLRFAEALIDLSCVPGEPCKIAFRAATIVLDAPLGAKTATDGAPTRLTLVHHEKPASRPVPIQIEWADVLSENGVTLERRGRDWVKLEKPECGHRPWRKCSGA